MKIILFCISLIFVFVVVAFGFWGNWFNSPILSKKQPPIEVNSPNLQPQPDEKQSLKRACKSANERQGFYTIIGQPPDEFSLFDEFYLQTMKTEKKPTKQILTTPKGYLLSDGKKIAFNKLTLDKQSLMFETGKIDGVSYRFTGKFVENIYEFEGKDVFLEGKLTKFEQNKQIAEQDFKFDFYVEGC